MITSARVLGAVTILLGLYLGLPEYYRYRLGDTIPYSWQPAIGISSAIEILFWILVAVGLTASLIYMLVNRWGRAATWSCLLWPRRRRR